jgi:hypothetical protein
MKSKKDPDQSPFNLTGILSRITRIGKLPEQNEPNPDSILSEVYAFEGYLSKHDEYSLRLLISST